MPGVDYYAVLGIEPVASDEEVKAAYRRAVKAAHPDHGGTEGLFGLVQEAGEHLLDPSARASYDSGAAAVALREDRTPVIADPWGEDWNDTAPLHSPTRPPAFATPWWQEDTQVNAAVRSKRIRKGSRDQWQARHAPPPVEIRVAQGVAAVFLLALIALRWFASSPRPVWLLDFLGFVWITLPIIGAIAAIRGLWRIRIEPMRFGSVSTAWWALAINCVLLAVSIGGGLIVLRTPI